MTYLCKNIRFWRQFRPIFEHFEFSSSYILVQQSSRSDCTCGLIGFFFCLKFWEIGFSSYNSSRYKNRLTPKCFPSHLKLDSRDTSKGVVRLGQEWIISDQIRWIFRWNISSLCFLFFNRLSVEKSHRIKLVPWANITLFEVISSHLRSSPKHMTYSYLVTNIDVALNLATQFCWNLWLRCASARSVWVLLTQHIN